MFFGNSNGEDTKKSNAIGTFFHKFYRIFVIRESRIGISIKFPYLQKLEPTNKWIQIFVIWFNFTIFYGQCVTILWKFEEFLVFFGKKNKFEQKKKRKSWSETTKLLLFLLLFIKNRKIRKNRGLKINLLSFYKIEVIHVKIFFKLGYLILTWVRFWIVDVRYSIID